MISKYAKKQYETNAQPEEVDDDALDSSSEEEEDETQDIPELDEGELSIWISKILDFLFLCTYLLSTEWHKKIMYRKFQQVEHVTNLK